VASSLAVFKAAIRVKSDKIMFKNQENGENMESNENFTQISI